MPYLQPFEKKIYIINYKPPFPLKYNTLEASKIHTNFVTNLFCAFSHTVKTQLFYYDYKYFILAHRKLHYIAITKQGDGEQNTKLN